MNHADELGIADEKKSRKERRALLARFRNDHLAGAVLRAGALPGQWALLSNLERLMRTGNKGRTLPPQVIQPLVDFLRPETEPADGDKPKAQKKGK